MVGTQRHGGFGVSLLHLSSQGKDLTKHFFIRSTLNRNGHQFFDCLLILKCEVEMTLARTHCATVGLNYIVSLIEILNRSTFFRD